MIENYICSLLFVSLCIKTKVLLFLIQHQGLNSQRLNLRLSGGPVLDIRDVLELEPGGGGDTGEQHHHNPTHSAHTKISLESVQLEFLVNVTKSEVLNNKSTGGRQERSNHRGR